VPSLSSGSERIGGWCSVTATNGNVVIQVRQAVEAARRAGQPAPGRPTLVKLTGATDHAVRKALAELAGEKAHSGHDGPNPGEARADERDLNAGRYADVDERNEEVVAHPRESGGAALPAFNQPASAGEHRSSLAPPGGRFVAWAGFVFGSVMSIAANVLHAWLPATHEPSGWSPGLAPQVGAAVWPVGLMLAVEALSRVPWPKGLLWGLARFGGAGAVALGSAVISYGHLRGVLLAWQYGALAAAVGPLVLDGLMVVCGFALLAMSRTKADDAGLISSDWRPTG
jgi:hypothetical protein